jgi:DNA-binding NtrC family response regulator
MPEKVLLVDDEREFIDALAERMQARGMDVSKTTSPKKALKMAEEGSYDAIVLDLRMPEMGGLEVLKILKKKKPDIQIILLTGHASVQTGIAAMKMGAMDLVEKPVSIKELIEKIQKAQAKKMILVEKRNEKKIKDIMIRKGW